MTNETNPDVLAFLQDVQDRAKPRPRVVTSETELCDLVGFETTKVPKEMLERFSREDAASSQEETTRIDPSLLETLQERAQHSDRQTRQPQRTQHKTPPGRPSALGLLPKTEEKREQRPHKTKAKTNPWIFLPLLITIVLVLICWALAKTHAQDYLHRFW